MAISVVCVRERQKSVVLSRIREICDPVPHAGLKKGIDGAPGFE